MIRAWTKTATIFRIVLFLSLSSFAVSKASAEIWTILAADPKGDALDASLADAAQLGYRYDKAQDFLWFRITLYGQPGQSFGINIAVDSGAADMTKVSWWGANKGFKFDKLVTAWVTRQGNTYQGIIGVADASGVNAKQFNNLSQNNLIIRVEGDSVIIGVKRTDITDKMKMNLIASVGAGERWNDDLPNAGFATLDLAGERPQHGLREIDTSRNNLEFPTDYKTLPPERPPVIEKLGDGKPAIILVPGIYSGQDSFHGFMAANKSRYRFYVVTPPGVNGTPARPLPATGPEWPELTWTHSLERDLLNLINREQLVNPIIIAERQPASVAALELAGTHPQAIGGVVLTATDLPPFFPTPRDPTRKTPASYAERLDIVETGFAQKWFKYVTPETWLSNDYAPEWFSADSSAGQQAWRESEAAPLSVKIRYTCEFWLSNITPDFSKLNVPILVLAPGFDEKFLADPANAFVRNAFVNGWDPAQIKQSRAEVVRVPGARLLLLKERSAIVDDAIAHFVAAHQ
jgi:pimeloyl-ACP methyl ester carboxylesterase